MWVCQLCHCVDCPVSLSVTVFTVVHANRCRSLAGMLSCCHAGLLTALLTQPLWILPEAAIGTRFQCGTAGLLAGIPGSPAAIYHFLMDAAPCNYVVSSQKVWKTSLKACRRQVFRLLGYYSGPSILRPPMGPRKCGLILQVVLK